MKLSKLSFTVIIILIGVLFTSCKKNDGVSEVDPSNPDDLSKVLVIPGADLEKGDPPMQSNSPESPTIDNNQSSASIVAGSTLYLPFNFQTSTDGLGGYAGCYVQVSGATTYFDIFENSSITDGLLVLPVEVPDDVLEGDFCLSYSIYDSNQRVSNTLTTCITIGGVKECPAFESGSDGLTIASYDLGDESGLVEIEYDTYSVPDRIDIFYDDEWVGGSGSRLSSSDIPPVSNCYDGTDGYVGEYDSITFNYDPKKAKTVTIYMSGCLGGGTAWDIAVSCPYPSGKAQKNKLLVNTNNPELISKQ